MQPALAWEYVLAASALWTITYNDTTDCRKSRFVISIVPNRLSSTVLLLQAWSWTLKLIPNGPRISIHEITRVDSKWDSVVDECCFVVLSVLALLQLLTGFTLRLFKTLLHANVITRRKNHLAEEINVGFRKKLSSLVVLYGTVPKAPAVVHSRVALPHRFPLPWTSASQTENYWRKLRPR